MKAPQEIFDETVRHLAAQKRQSIFMSWCVYRHPSGRKCAYGYWIPDVEYKPEFENQSCVTLKNDFSYIAPAFRDEHGAWASLRHQELASGLQSAHDSCTDAKDLQSSLRLAADGLNTDVVDLIKEWS